MDYFNTWSACFKRKIWNIIFQKCCILIESECVWLLSCKMSINCWCLLEVRGTLHSWESGSFRTKSCSMGQNVGFIYQLVPVTLNLLSLSSSKSYFRGNFQLFDNANHRNKMRMSVSLWYNVTQTQVTFKYPHESRVLKYCKHKYNDKE
jgi:hypothetical protein